MIWGHGTIRTGFKHETEDETHGVVDEAGTGGRSGQAKQSCEAAELALGLSLLTRVAALAAFAEKAGAEGDGERAKEHEGRKALELGVLGLVARDGGTGGVERVELAVGGGVEEVVLADAENPDHLLVEAGHHASLGGALAHAEEGVDVLGGAEGLLPELEVDGGRELLEARVEVALEGVGIAEVDRVRLVRVLLRRGEVGAKGLAEAAELGLALVGEAEGEGLVRDGLRRRGQRFSGEKRVRGQRAKTDLVENFEPGVVAEDVERGAVRLPQEPEPGRDEGAVGAIAALLLADGAEEDALGGLTGLEVLDLGGDDSVDGGGLVDGGSLKLIDLGEGLGELGAALLEELLDDDLYAGDGSVLGDVLVHVETLLGGAALAEVDT